jgi:hypothetical protein
MNIEFLRDRCSLIDIRYSLFDISIALLYEQNPFPSYLLFCL